MDETKVVEIKNLTKKFGDVKAVDDVSLDVKRGEFLVILGPSGSGKSTLMMMIAGFMKPDEGDILIDGVRVNDKPPYERNAGMVFQSLALFPHMSVHDNIAFPLRMRRMAREEIEKRVEEVLDIVRLPGLGKRKIHELSGGQQQRVALARTLVFKPSISLLDEPSERSGFRNRIRYRCYNNRGRIENRGVQGYRYHRLGSEIGSGTRGDPYFRQCLHRLSYRPLQSQPVPERRSGS